MKSFMKLLAATFLFLFTTATVAAEWAMFHGPDGNNQSAETGLLTAWSQDGPPLLWRIGGIGEGKPKAPPFETLVPKGVAITIPVKDFESVGGAIDENEKGPVERILLETVFDDGGQTVERFTRIDGSGRNVNGMGTALRDIENA